MIRRYNLNFSGEQEEPLSEINTTPLVDVMLVLLIIFLITIPVVTSSLTVEPPNELNEVKDMDRDIYLIVIDRFGNYYDSNNNSLSVSTIENKFKIFKDKNPNLKVHILSDKASKYKSINTLFSMAERVGLENLAILTKP